MIRIKRIRKKIIRPKECYFCKAAIVPDYKDNENLKKFISERGKIIGRMYSGLCLRHQRQLARSVKRARYISLLPYIVRPL